MKTRLDYRWLQHEATVQTWKGLFTRCENPSNASYRYYGAKGVRVSKRWRSYKNFLADLGERPKGTTLGRFGDVGNYEPGNCAWMTSKQQAAERTKGHRISESVRRQIRSEIARAGGKARAKKYDKEILSKWAKMGGRPPRKVKEEEQKEKEGVQ